MSTIQNREDTDIKIPHQTTPLHCLFISEEISEDISRSFNKEISKKSNPFFVLGGRYIRKNGQNFMLIIS